MGQVLAVLNLLSSVALYNNLNIIDRSSIEKLSFAVETGPTPPSPLNPPPRHTPHSQPSPPSPATPPLTLTPPELRSRSIPVGSLPSP